MRCPAIIEEKIFQEMISLLPGLRLVRPLCRQLLLDGIEQGLVDDRRLFAGQYLTSVFDLADEEAVTEELSEATPAERNASAGLAVV